MPFFCTLASGSSGNASLYVDAHACVLIDAGANTKTLSAALAGFSLTPRDLTHILITHAHSDHISALPVLLKRTDAQLIASEDAFFELAQAIAYDDIPHDNAAVFSPGEAMTLNGLYVQSFSVPHDAGGSCGFTLGDGAGRVAYCTDLGCVTAEVFGALRGARTVVIESNHDVDMLRLGGYPAYLKRRILSDRGHLSNADCARTVAALAQGGAAHIVLAHLSEENNTPQAAEQETRGALRRIGAEAAVSVQIAPRYGPGRPIALDT